MTGKRLAIIKLSSIGDVVLASAVPRALKKANPLCEITWVVEQRCAEIVEANPFVDDVIVAADANLASLRCAGAELRGRAFGTVLDLQGIMKSSLLVAMSGAERRVAGSFARGMARRAATEIIDCGGGHAAELYLRCGEALGADVSDPQLVAPITDADRQFAEEFLAVQSSILNPQSSIVGLNPGASHSDKRWSPERFAQVADELIERDGVEVILFGSPGDRGIGDIVKGAMRNKPIDVVGQTTLRQLAALAERCSLFITNDTGPMHLAVAAGARVVGIFGASNPHFTGPFGDGHVVFWKTDSSDYAKRHGRELLDAVSVAEVVSACREALREAARQRGESREAVAVAIGESNAAGSCR